MVTSVFLKERVARNERKHLKICYLKLLGVDEANSKNLSLKEALKDNTRIEFYHTHLLALQSAIRWE
jgi:beta-glucosidase/6-phospho-beta-glucosidase/beta-galactosidase